jgi:aconitate hydratase
MIFMNYIGDMETTRAPGSPPANGRDAAIDSAYGSLDSAYASLRHAIEIARARLGRPLCLAEKLLFGHLVEPETQELVPGRSQLRLRPDRVVLQDVLGQTAMLQLMQTRRTSVAVPTSIHCDHLIQARTGASDDLEASVAENGEVYDFLRAAAAFYGAEFWPPGAGIIHQVVLETYARP